MYCFIMSPTSEAVIPAKYRLSFQKIPELICKFLDWPVKVIITVHIVRNIRYKQYIP